MNNQEYLDCLKSLGLRPCSKHTAKMLGLSISQLYRISRGDCAVSETLAILLRRLTQSPTSAPGGQGQSETIP